MSALEARWTEEALRLYRRYEREIVEGHDFCPWAARVRRDGRMSEQVLLQVDDVDIESSLRVIDAFPIDVDLALLFYPRFAGGRDVFERFAGRVRDAHIAQKDNKAPFVFVVFHPDAKAHVEEPDRLIPFLRRTPDPTIQIVRRAVLDRVRAAVSEGTQFVDPRALESWQPQPPSIRERIGQANFTTTLRIGVETLGRQLDDIIHDRERTYRTLEGDTENPKPAEPNRSSTAPELV